MGEEIDLVDVFYMFAAAEKEGEDPVMTRKDITIALKVSILFYVLNA